MRLKRTLKFSIKPSPLSLIKGRTFIIAARKQIDEEEKAIIINDLLLCKNSDYRAIVPAIKIPALLIANRYDKIIPCEATEHMHRQLQNSKFVVFDQRGHIPFFENSEEFNRVVDEFIASLPENNTACNWKIRIFIKR